MAVFTIGDIDVETQIALERFSCDLSCCKGACCTLPGGRGAPIAPEEVDQLVLAIPVVTQYLSPEHLSAIGAFGVVEKSNGLYFTTCVDDRACVFVYYDHGIARCSIEQAHSTGAYAWRKPLSCHLFPIRRSQGSREKIRYEHLRECAPAIDNGNKQNMPMYRFLRDALIRAYGEAWYGEFLTRCEEVNSHNTKTVKF
jgi:hypothetical protein